MKKKEVNEDEKDNGAMLSSCSIRKCLEGALRCTAAGAGLIKKRTEEIIYRRFSRATAPPYGCMLLSRRVNKKPQNS